MRWGRAKDLLLWGPRGREGNLKHFGRCLSSLGALMEIGRDTSILSLFKLLTVWLVNRPIFQFCDILVDYITIIIFFSLFKSQVFSRMIQGLLSRREVITLCDSPTGEFPDHNNYQLGNKNYHWLDIVTNLQVGSSHSTSLTWNLLHQ